MSSLVLNELLQEIQALPFRMDTKADLPEGFCQEWLLLLLVLLLVLLILVVVILVIILEGQWKQKLPC